MKRPCGVGDGSGFLAGLAMSAGAAPLAGGFGRAQGTLLGGPDASLVKSDTGDRTRLRHEAGSVYAGDQLPNHTAAGAVEVSPEKQQLIGVEYGTAEYETTANTIHAAARVTLDETKIVKVQTRLEGWIGRVFADFTASM